MLFGSDTTLSIKSWEILGIIIRESMECGRKNEWLIFIKNFMRYGNMLRDWMIGIDFWVLLGCMIIFKRIRRLLFQGVRRLFVKMFQRKIIKIWSKITSEIHYTLKNIMNEKEHNVLDNNLGQKLELFIQCFCIHFSSGVLIVKMMWSCQVDDFNLGVSDPRRPSQIRSKLVK